MDREAIRWHSISKEGLPTQDGVYLVRDVRHGNSLLNNYRVSYFTVEANKDVTPQYCCYSHWMKIPDITEKI